MSAGLALQALRVAVVAVPAVLIVLFAGLIAALALMMDQGRREYALEFAKVCTSLAAVLVDGKQVKSQPPRQRPKSIQ